MKKRCRDGVTCVVLCTLPSIYLVCVVFGTAIPTSFYILENVFHTCTYMYMNNQVYRALLRKNENGKKEKETKLQQPQRLRKI